MPRPCLCAALLAATPALAQDIPSLCADSETVYFSAEVAGGAEDAGGAGDAMVSICGAADLDGPDAWLEYRFGTGAFVQRRFPADRSPGAFTYTRYTRPRVTYLDLALEIDDITLKIHEGFDADADPQDYASQIIVGADGTELERLVLRQITEPLSLMVLEDHFTVTQ